MCIAFASSSSWFMITFAKEVDFIVSSVLFLNILCPHSNHTPFFLFSWVYSRNKRFKKVVKEGLTTPKQGQLKKRQSEEWVNASTSLVNWETNHLLFFFLFYHILALLNPCVVSFCLQQQVAWYALGLEHKTTALRHNVLRIWVFFLSIHPLRQC